MSKYNIRFAKRGYMIYTSHLDMQRLFKRAFKRAGIDLSYSQGYNPHPLMSFAQPLSLGYYSESEFLEFKTKEDHSERFIEKKLNEVMPKGLVVLSCARMGDQEKTLASRCVAAGYKIILDHNGNAEAAKAMNDKVPEYLDQQEIVAYKKTKKKKEPVPTDIKPKIRKLESEVVCDKVIMTTELDAGSDSNLSPELLISTFIAFSGYDLPRENVDIMRFELICK